MKKWVLAFALFAWLVPAAAEEGAQELGVDRIIMGTPWPLSLVWPRVAALGYPYGAIVYGRGPLFFVALREKMGTESFDAFIKEYTETLSWGIATPEFLQSLAEARCACDLDELFDEWVYP